MGDITKSLMTIHEGCNMFSLVSKKKGKPLIRKKLDEIDGIELKSYAQGDFMDTKLKQDFIPKKPFEEIRQEMTEIGNGIFKKTLTVGYGELLKEASQLTLMYSIYLENQTLVYDSTYQSQEVCLLVLGKEEGILPGFDRALRSMRSQEKAEFIVPRILSAEDGDPPTEKELLNGYLVIEVLRATDPEDTEEKSRILNNSELALKHVEELRERAKAAFSARFYRIAVDEYLEAVFVLRNVLMLTMADNEKRMELLMRMYLNAGMVFNRMDQPKLAHYTLEQAVEMLENNVSAMPALKGKIYLHASRSLRLTDDLPDAFTYLKEAQDCLGNVKDVKDEFKILYQSFKHHSRWTLFAGPVRQAIGAPNGFETLHPKSNVFKAAFEKMLNTFQSAKEKKRTFYGVYNKENVEVAKKVVKNMKVKLQLLQEQHTICYVLTKK